MRSGLPIDEALPRLRAALADGRNAVLVAPPGAGKSTVVPLALLDEPWTRGQKIVLLEPRRLAARAVAARMASSLGELPGDTVGYRMRLETRVERGDAASRSSPKACSRGCCRATPRSRASRPCCSTSSTSAA